MAPDDVSGLSVIDVKARRIVGNDAMIERRKNALSREQLRDQGER